MLQGGPGQLLPPDPDRVADLGWFVVCFCLGFVGLIALIPPLFGFLSYLGALVFPIAALGEIGFGVAAVVGGGSWRRAYLLGNVGLAAGNVAMLASSLLVLIVQQRWQPNPDAWRPLYFGVVMMGLAGGITWGMLLRPKPR